MASKITIKRSTAAVPPAGLSFGEMAFVQGTGLTADQLYIGISGGSPIWIGAEIGTTGTWTDTAAQTSLATQYAIEQRIGAKISANTAGVSSFNGLTGAVSGVTTSAANTFTALNTFSAGISTAGGTFGTPTQLIGTNITGTATNFTASNVTTNANLTGVITSVGNGTTLGSFSSAQLLAALTTETGSGLVVFGTSPTITTSLVAGSASFDLIDTTATIVNFARGATALNIGNASGTATFGGNVIVTGDLTVNGTTTTLNTTTLAVEDFNITMGLTLTSAANCTGAGIGIGVGTGITFAYDHSTSAGWLSSVNLDLASAKVYKIGGTSVLSSSALGSGVTGSSLTQVGTITSGTWNASFAAGLIVNADINNFAAIADTKLGTISSIGKVSNSATTASALAGNSTIVARDGSGNFAAGTITAALTGNASTATTATNINVTEQTTGTMFLVGVAAASFTAPLLVNAVPSTALTYDVVTGELSATLIDGGSF